MEELETINKWLGGHRITIKGFRHFASTEKKLVVCEIGCGGGDNLKAISNYAVRHGIEIEMIGIDIKKECIDYARENCKDLKKISWICSDFRHAILPVKPDIIFSSLFCHHFQDEAVIEIFQWMKENAKLGFYINDLHRHPFAYYSIKLLTSVFSKSYLVINDAPLSVQRGFSRVELDKMIRKVLCKDSLWTCNLYWKWAFRWLIVFYKTEIPAIDD